MNSNPRFRSKTAYYGWIGVFVLGLIGVIALLYTATQQIDYVWRWYNIPKYFANADPVNINAELDGDVKSITVNGDKSVILIDGPDGSESYEVPSQDVAVDEGDYVYMGDRIASYKKWKPGLLAQGMWMTLKVSFYSIIFGILLGLIGGIARMSSNPALKWSAITYVEIIRGSPLLVQIFIWYFVLATMINSILSKYGIPGIDAVWYGIASLSCFTGAYVTEIVRAGIQSIHRGQIEAARSLGMNGGQAMWHIILPQAMKRILPPLAGQFISLIKDSSLLGMIAVRELTKATREGISASLQPYEFWFACAALYLLLTFTLSMFVQYLERRMATQ